MFVYFKEPVDSRKPVFLCFSLYFFGSLLWLVEPFVGKNALLFSSEKYAPTYAFQYLYALDFFLLSFSIVYVVLDSLFENFKSYQKFVCAALIVGGVFALYYHPYFEDPKYAYNTQDIADWRVVDKSVSDLKSNGIESPTAADVAATSQLGVWKDGKQIGTLLPEETVRRVGELLPYVDGENYNVLLLKPLYMNTIYMNILCVVFIFLYFGYQYKNDPPQGAYI